MWFEGTPKQKQNRSSVHTDVTLIGGLDWFGGVPAPEGSIPTQTIRA